MNKKVVLATLLMMFVVIGCKIPKEFLSNLTATPNPLELKGGKIECKVEGTFPEKYFVKNMVLEVVPVLKSTKTGAVLRGEPRIYQGEKIEGNNSVIRYKNGGKYEHKISFNYDPKFDQCELYLEATAKVKKKTVKFEPVKVAEGLIVTSNLVYSNPSELGGSKFISGNLQKAIEEKENAEIKFLIQQANIRPSETKSIIELTNKIKNIKPEDNIVLKGIEISSYASPDGGVELNEKLAKARENSTKNYINSQMKKLKKQVEVSATFTAQDWEGFKELMENQIFKTKILS